MEETHKETGENLNETPSFLSENTNQNRKKSGVTTIVLIIVVIIILGAGGFFGLRYLKHNSQPQQPVDTSPTPSATPAPTRSLSRADWSFEVLNGSGIAGEARKTADKLTSLGYIVVKTGNADKDTYAQNELFIRTGKDSEADLLLADLKTNFKIASVSGTLTEGTASARLIIGKE